MAKAKYKVLKPVRYGGARHKVGAIVNMEKDHADALPEGTVVAAEAATKPPDKEPVTPPPAGQ